MLFACARTIALVYVAAVTSLTNALNPPPLPPGTAMASITCLSMMMQVLVEIHPTIRILTFMLEFVKAIIRRYVCLCERVRVNVSVCACECLHK